MGIHTPYLQCVADIDEEGLGVGGHGDPGAVPQRDLQPGRVVGAEHGDDLRVGVLAEPRQPPRPHRLVGPRRVVVHPQHGVAVPVQHQPAEHAVVVEAQPLRHQLQHPARHAPHRRDVLVQNITDKTEIERESMSLTFPCHVEQVVRFGTRSHHQIFRFISQGHPLGAPHVHHPGLRRTNYT